MDFFAARPSKKLKKLVWDWVKFPQETVHCCTESASKKSGAALVPGAPGAR